MEDILKLVVIISMAVNCNSGKNITFVGDCVISVSFCLVCAYVREENPRALAHQYACSLLIVRYLM